MRNRSDPPAVRLPDEIVKRLSTSGIPRVAADLVRDEGADMPLSTAAMRAVIDRARTEEELYAVSARLAEARGEVVRADELVAVISRLKDELRQSREETARLRNQLQQATARDALAVHSEGTGH